MFPLLFSFFLKKHEFELNLSVVARKLFNFAGTFNLIIMKNLKRRKTMKQCLHTKM